MAGGKIFLSYRRDDTAGTAGRLYDRLRQRFDVFYDVFGIPRGTNFKEYLVQKVSECDVLLVVVGRRWAVDVSGKPLLQRAIDFPRIEVETAIARGIPCLPVLVENASMPEVESLPTSIRDIAFINAAVVTPGRDFDAHRVVGPAPGEATCQCTRFLSTSMRVT